MSISYHLVQTIPQLQEAMDYLGKNEIVALDLEGEFNLHRYGMHLCLLQMSDGKEVFLLDPLKLEHLDPFFEIYENPDIKKIAHGPQSDFLLLDNLYKRTPRNVFDTQKAAILLGYEGTSLNALLKETVDVEKNSKIREKDWGQRPLPEKMLTYAAKDVLYLLEIYDKLVDELNERGRSHWAAEENSLLELVRYAPKENPHLLLKGTSRLSDRELNILKEIYEVRDKVARKLDKPASFVIQNPRMLDLAQEPPQGPDDWKELRQVHPRLKQFAHLFHQAVEKGRTTPIPRKVRESRGPGFKYLMANDQDYRETYNTRKDELTRLRELIDAEYDIAPMILSNKTIHRLASNSEGEVLKNWQREVILDMGRKHNIPVEYILEEATA